MTDIASAARASTLAGVIMSPRPLAYAGTSAPRSGVWRSVRLAWSEARPVVQGMFQLRFVSGAFVAAPALGFGHVVTFLVAAVSWLCATWQVYLLNGLCDQVEDRCNGSGRPLATGELDATTARRICRSLGVAALLLGLLVSPLFMLLVGAFLVLGWRYSATGNPQKGNVAGFVATVTAGGALTYLAGCVAGGGRLTPELLVLMAAMSLWMGSAGMTKDLADVSGDRAAGRRTLPVLLGDARARCVVAALAVTAGCVMGICALAFARSMVVPALFLLLGAVAVAVCAIRGTGAAGRSAQRRPYRIFMISQYVVHAAVLL